MGYLPLQAEPFEKRRLGCTTLQLCAGMKFLTIQAEESGYWDAECIQMHVLASRLLGLICRPFGGASISLLGIEG